MLGAASSQDNRDKYYSSSCRSLNTPRMGGITPPLSAEKELYEIQTNVEMFYENLGLGYLKL